MNARVSKEELALLFPNAMSRYFRDEDEYMQAPAAERPGLLVRLGTALRWFAEWPKRRTAMEELSQLSDHELADIGLTRGEVRRIFDPGFAAERERSTSLR